MSTLIYYLCVEAKISRNCSTASTGSIITSIKCICCFSPIGIKYQKNFKFDSVLNCGTISPKIKLTEIEFTHRLFSGSAEHVPAMIKIKEMVNSYNFSSHAFAIGIIYFILKIHYLHLFHSGLRLEK